MQISRSNYIRQAQDERAITAGAEWDEQHAAWLASLPADTEEMRGYLASLETPWRREEYDPERHGSKEAIEAAAATWAAEREAEAARQEVEARVAAEEAARAEAKRAEEEAARAESLRAAREAAAATLEQAAAVVQAALAAGKLDGPEVAEAYATIALAGAARLRG